MNRKISRSQMAGINLTKKILALVTIKVSLGTLPTNGKLKFNSNNNDWKSNYSKSSGNNNECKYNYNNDDDNINNNNKNNNNNKKFIDNSNNKSYDHN